MLGLKNLPLNKLTTAFMVVSAAMMIFAASAHAIQIEALVAGALVLIGGWIVVAVELYKRFFGGQSPLSGSRSTGDRREHQARLHD